MLYGVRSTLLGEVGLRYLGCSAVDASTRRAGVAEPTGSVAAEAIARLREAGVPANADGTYNAMTSDGRVVRVRAP
jgi:hypothetical protein